MLTYAIMMLNTDLHSTQVKKKMTFEVCACTFGDLFYYPIVCLRKFYFSVLHILLQEFIRNQRKTNNGENFPPEFLNSVYNKVK